MGSVLTIDTLAPVLLCPPLRPPCGASYLSRDTVVLWCCGILRLGCHDIVASYHVSACIIFVNLYVGFW
jgi:hypothetical protein